MFAWSQMSCWAYLSPLAKSVEDGLDFAAAASVNEAARSPSLESWVDFDMKILIDEVGREQHRPAPLHWVMKERDEACRCEIDSLFHIIDDNDDIDVEIDASNNNAPPVVLLDTPLFRRLRSMDRNLDSAGKAAHDAEMYGRGKLAGKLYSHGLNEDEIELNTERLACALTEENLSPYLTHNSIRSTGFLQDTEANLNNLSQSLGVSKLCDVAICNNVKVEENMELFSEDETHPLLEKSV